ncbi:MAG: C-terminal helicase domain-containing protein [Acidimicrobiales bacterium]
MDRLQITNVGLLRSMLLKRLESSTAAIEVTLRRLIDSHHAFQRGLAQGFVIIGDALRDYASSDAESVEEFLAGLDEDSSDQVAPSGEFDRDTLESDVAGDVALFERLHQLAVHRRRVGPDAKLLRLAQVLGDIAEQASRPDREALSESERRKVIIFSTYADTVSEVHQRLAEMIDIAPIDSPLAAYRGRLAPAVFGAQGSEGQLARAEVLAGFCPRTAGELRVDGTPKAEDRFDILVTSDVLAEGVNLQQAGHMVNFDLPWNPMRLVQRHGRIDRIGSPHKRISIGCFFPGEDLDRLLGLEETLQRKIAYANAAVGVGTILPNQVADPSVEVLLHDVRSDIEDLYNEDATLLISGGGSEALSGEEYRRRLSDALASSNGKRNILGLPFGAGSGFTSLKVAQPGYVFCIRIGDEPKPWFRFVAVDSESWEPLVDEIGQPRITDDTLTCLMAADPGTSQGVQVVSDTALNKAFDAWEVAQADVHTKWTFLTDKANLQPKIEKALRDAYALVTEHGEFLGLDQLDALQAKLNGRWDSGVVKAIRQIVRSDDSPKKKVQDIDRFVTDAGLPIPQAIKPLRPVRREDVRVVCWMAVQPAPPSAWPLRDSVNEG